MTLTQQFLGGRWQKYTGIYQGDKYMETGPMGSCVSVVAIAGNDIRGYHGGGGLKAVNFEEIKKAMPDVPNSRLIVVYANDSLDLVKGHIKEIIEEYKFRKWQWELYQSFNARISRTGAVTSTDSEAPVPRQRIFISMLADNVK